MIFINKHSVFQIDGCSFISQINRMINIKIPDGECFKFRISCLNSFFILMIKVTKACGEFAAARAWSGNNNNRIGCFDVFICSISVVTYNLLNISWIAFCGIMQVNLDASVMELVPERFCRRLILIPGIILFNR